MLWSPDDVQLLCYTRVEILYGAYRYDKYNELRTGKLTVNRNECEEVEKCMRERATDENNDEGSCCVQLFDEIYTIVKS